MTYSACREVENDITQIAISDAQKIQDDFEIGEETYEKIELESFGRRSVLAARQTLVSRIMDLEKDETYKKYKDRIGDIISAEVYQVWKKEILFLDEEGNELLLPKSEQIRTDFYKKGETLRAVVKRVDMRNASPVIILSRTDAAFLAKLLEQEVPEIFDGLIVIKNIVCEPGENAKVVVESFDDRIDAVGPLGDLHPRGAQPHGHRRDRVRAVRRRSRRGGNPADLDGSRRHQGGVRSQADPGHFRSGHRARGRLGGVGTLDHLVEGVTIGKASAVLAASIFHYETFSIAEAKAHMAKAGIPMRMV